MESNPRFQKQKKAVLAGLRNELIDQPLVELIAGLNKLTCCFTLQCCFGHFIHKNNRDPFNVDALPALGAARRVDYKVAYLALCLEYGPSGQDLYLKLEDIAAVDPDYIQFGSALWFWEKQFNSYVLQVEPERF